MRAKCTVLIGELFNDYYKRSQLVKFSHFSVHNRTQEFVNLELVLLEKVWESKTNVTKTISLRPG